MLNVKDFGAVGDGITDDTQAIQDAIDELNRRGGGYITGDGRYRVTGTVKATPATGLRDMTFIPDFDTSPEHPTLFQGD